MKIEILRDDVVDQIAAGEVVERPAQLVKELIENSLDAGATQISVEFGRGGRDVKIEDDGSGIEPEELRLAVARHATSKMRQYNDLWQLSSYGFRGEALASIAAVSQMRIQSSPNGKTAHELKVDFGTIQDPVESRRPQGTTIDVQNLFENVPARLKFMKSAGSEAGLIKNVVKAMALVHPHISWSVKQEDQIVALWPKTESYLQRAKDAFEQTELYTNKKSNGGFTCEVVLSSPNVTARSSKQIYTFVNGRFIQDRSILAAVMEAYRGLLMHGEYPMGCVYLTVPGEDLDVNVSPTKSQVKYKDSSLVFRIVQSTVRELLEGAPWLQGVLSPRSYEKAPEMPLDSFVRSVSGQSTTGQTAPTNFDFSLQAPEFTRTQYQRKENEPFRLEEVREVLKSAEAILHKPAPSSETALWQHLNLIGQAHLTYIVAEKSGAVVFVDQHAAHERVMYERLMSDIKNKKVEIQSYLLPLTVDLTEDEVSAFCANKESLELFGMDVEALSPTTLAINSAPAMMREDGICRAIEKLARDLSETGGSFAMEKAMGDIVATMACHSAIRAGQSLSPQEMQALLAQMDDFALSSFCPHGRPVFVEYPIAKLERDFGRIV